MRHPLLFLALAALLAACAPEAPAPAKEPVTIRFAPDNYTPAIQASPYSALADAQFKTEQYVACVRGGEAEETCVKQVEP